MNGTGTVGLPWGGDPGIHPHRDQSEDTRQSPRCEWRLQARTVLARPSADGAHPPWRPSCRHPVRPPRRGGVGRQPDHGRASRRPRDRAPGGASFDRCRHGPVSRVALDESFRLTGGCRAARRPQAGSWSRKTRESLHTGRAKGRPGTIPPPPSAEDAPCRARKEKPQDDGDDALPRSLGSRP